MKKHTESRDKQDQVATHRVKDTDVELETPWGKKVVCNAPVLVDILVIPLAFYIL